mmetsp:Transcript_14060/g.52752  ORF Transcript_14060/g.52752 Transcript_14060/m.52752 type:complete len:156 (+) Transcript_14060:246-713(+)
MCERLSLASKRRRLDGPSLGVAESQEDAKDLSPTEVKADGDDCGLPGPPREQVRRVYLCPRMVEVHVGDNGCKHATSTDIARSHPKAFSADFHLEKEFCPPENTVRPGQAAQQPRNLPRRGLTRPSLGQWGERGHAHHEAPGRRHGDLRHRRAHH